MQQLCYWVAFCFDTVDWFVIVFRELNWFACDRKHRSISAVSLNICTKKIVFVVWFTFLLHIPNWQHILILKCKIKKLKITNNTPGLVRELLVLAYVPINYSKFVYVFLYLNFTYIDKTSRSICEMRDQQLSIITEVL